MEPKYLPGIFDPKIEQELQKIDGREMSAALKDKIFGRDRAALRRVQIVNQIRLNRKRT